MKTSIIVGALMLLISHHANAQQLPEAFVLQQGLMILSGKNPQPFQMGRLTLMG